MNIDERLKELGIELPRPPQPVGNYQAWVLHGDLLFLSGQLPIENGQPRFTGRVGAELNEEQGYAAARLAALNVLAQIRTALGGFDRLHLLLRVEGHVASAPDWTNAPKVLNGASDLLITVLGERGRHTRAALIIPRLPLNVPVQLVATASVRPPAK